jgi:F0F1-type ATP synthase assembly protein I
MESQIKPKPKSKTTFFVLMGLGTAILLAAPVIVLFAVGFFFDKLFNTAPTLMIIGGGVGFLGGTYNVYKLLKTMK